jgi:hypothetical protein
MYMHMTGIHHCHFVVRELDALATTTLETVGQNQIQLEQVG